MEYSSPEHIKAGRFMNVKLVSTISLGPDFYPNSIVVSGNLIYGCDAKGRIFSVDTDGLVRFEFGSEGLGRYKFRQAVFITFGLGKLIVADWHNHRVVFYDEKHKYIDEFGHLSISTQSLMANLIARSKKVISNHEYLLNHCEVDPIKEVNEDSLFKKVNRYFYYLFKQRSKGIPFNKPNGIAFYFNTMVVTQKNNRSIQLFSFDNNDVSTVKLEREITKLDNTSLGRLGNCIMKDSQFYICDETNDCIWVIDKYGNYINKILPQTNVKPFSCCFINEKTLVVGGVAGLFIMNLESQKIEFQDLTVGEVHSVVYKKQTNEILVCCRDSGIIKVLSAE